MKEQKIVVPEYVTKVKLSDSRRPTYYSATNRIPNKYKSDRFIFKDKKYSTYTKKLLYDTVDKKFVVKNERFAGTPRYLTIGGNMLYAGIHEKIRMNVVDAIKDSFRPYVQKLRPITKFPIQIDAELHTKPEYRNWDVDNLWIYVKAFQDLLIECKIIPDDCVKYITKPPSFEFFPVPESRKRKMIFTLREDNRAVTNHVMFRTSPVPITYVRGAYAALETAIYVYVGEIKAGEVSMRKEATHFRATIGIGKKKLLYDKLDSALGVIRYWSIQYNAMVVLDNTLGMEYNNYDKDKFRLLLMKNLANEGIRLIIHNS